MTLTYANNLTIVVVPARAFGRDGFGYRVHPEDHPLSPMVIGWAESEEMATDLACSAVASLA